MTALRTWQALPGTLSSTRRFQQVADFETITDTIDTTGDETRQLTVPVVMVNIEQQVKMEIKFILKQISGVWGEIVWGGFGGLSSSANRQAR